MEEIQKFDRSSKSIQVHFCLSCKVNFLNRKTFFKHIRKEEHKLKEASSEIKQNTSSVGIYVRGFSAKTTNEELINYFSKYGLITSIHIAADFLLIDFNDEASVTKCMAEKKHCINHDTLMVRPKVSKTIQEPVDEHEDDVIYQSILDGLRPLNDFELEFLSMAQKLQPNVTETYNKYNEICKDICHSLQRDFPYVQVLPFGSTMTGLGFVNSDVDVYLSGVKAKPNDDVTCLYKIRQLLNRSQRFTNSFVISGAKIPIIKCVHVPTQVKCDINVKNLLGVFNSKFIYFFLNIDIKVKKAMMVLKCWGKKHQLSGQRHILSNYALVMMFLFYLQVKFNFPSVVSMQKNVEPQENSIWNGKFIPNYSFERGLFMSTSLLEVVKQFFEFYVSFPYSKDIVCPYLGQAVPRTYFDSPEKLPDVYKAYKRFVIEQTDPKTHLRTDTPLCVQDPFEHSRNLTNSFKNLEELIELCQLSKNICETGEHVLYKLLTSSHVPRPKNELARSIIHKADSLQINIRKSSSAKQYLQNDSRWFDVVLKFIMTALKDFLRFTMTSVDLEETPNKMNKKEDGTDISHKNKISFICDAKLNLWDSRNVTAKKLNLNGSEMTLIERETGITNILLEEHEDLTKLPDILTCKVTIENNVELAIVTFEKLKTYKKIFKSFKYFLGSSLLTWFDNYEKDLINNKAS